MALIEVQLPGAFTTVQDLGRPGFGPIGVSPSGAADALSLRLGNRLVGNTEGAAALEMTLLGGTFRFPDGADVALTGSDFAATLHGAAPDGAPLAPGRSARVQPGQTLRLGSTRSGARCYLCVRGGIEVPLFLGSASTHALSGLGGFQGRALKRGDVLEIGAASGPAPMPPAARALAEGAAARLLPRKLLRVTEGPQSEWFPEQARQFFYSSTFRVTEESNRVGLRLGGAAVPAPPGREMITEGVALGAVQIPPGGQPIIVFVEQQTTGGYPVLANVISADLPSVGQLRPRDDVRFERVSFAEARALLLEQEEWVASGAWMSGWMSA